MHKITKREKDIALQWRANLLTVNDVAKKLKKPRSSTYIILARALKQIHYDKTKD